MEIILWIVGAIIVIALAYVLLKLLAALCGLSLVFGFITWLIFDNFWIGAVIGAIITIVLVIKNPSDFFESAMESAPRSSSPGSSPSGRYLDTDEGRVDISHDYAGGVVDVYGRCWERQLDGSYRRV